MKLYLSSIQIPTPDDLAALLGRPLSQTRLALIPNAKDYFIPRARDFTVSDRVTSLRQLGLQVDVVDLRDYDDGAQLKAKLTGYDLVWAMGGNTFMLRYEMRRSGFDTIIKDLLDRGIVYGGDSAGALVAGTSIAGVEAADEPAFAAEVITDGMHLVPFVIMPHVDNPEFAEVLPVVRGRHDNMIELKDSQAVIFDGDQQRIVEG